MTLKNKEKVKFISAGAFDEEFLLRDNTFDGFHCQAGSRQRDVMELNELNNISSEIIF